MTTEYSIEAFYETGDSFHHEDTSTVLEMRWKDLDKAKAALKRIKEHYLWYDEMNGHSYKFREPKYTEPEWHKGMEYDFCLKVELDNGNFVEFCAPWCGYFETLYSAKIVVPADVDNDMEISI